MRSLFSIILALVFFIYGNAKDLKKLKANPEIPCIPEADFERYRPLAASYHQVIVRSKEGFKIFGQQFSADGKHVLSPTLLAPENGFNYAGQPLLVAVSSYPTATNGKGQGQGVVVTTEGLYIWGDKKAILDRGYKGFEQIDLPSEVAGDPSLIRDIKATYGGVAILTYEGNVYVKGYESRLYGDGSTSKDNNWHQSKVSNVDMISMNYKSVFVYTKDRKYYMWGENIYKGDGTGKMNSVIPLEIVSPVLNSKNPRMIASSYSNERRINGNPLRPVDMDEASYLVLEDKEPQRIFVLGSNKLGVLGLGEKVKEQNTWTTIPGMERIRRIDAMGSTYKFAAASAVTEDFIPYEWGQNDKYMISDANMGFLSNTGEPQYDPRVPSGIKEGDKITFIVNGGHITPLINMTRVKFGYVGHRVHGSMGTGREEDKNIKKYDFDNTPAIPLCNEGNACIKTNPMDITEHFINVKEEPIK